MANTAEMAINATLAGSIGSGNEYAGFIFENGLNGLLTYTSSSYPVAPDDSVNIGSPPRLPGYTVVAYWHTYPTNFADSNDPTGIDGPNQTNPFTNTLFSVNDEEYANNYSIYAYVGVENNEGFQWAQWQPGGAIGQTANFIDKGGVKAGC